MCQREVLIILYVCVCTTQLSDWQFPGGRSLPYHVKFPLRGFRLRSLSPMMSTLSTSHNGLNLELWDGRSLQFLTALRTDLNLKGGNSEKLGKVAYLRDNFVRLNSLLWMKLFVIVRNNSVNPLLFSQVLAYFILFSHLLNWVRPT